jgi:hypothetical protein
MKQFKRLKASIDQLIGLGDTLMNSRKVTALSPELPTATCCELFDPFPGNGDIKTFFIAP